MYSRAWKKTQVSLASLVAKGHEHGYMRGADRLLVEAPLMTHSQQNLPKEVLQTFYGFLVLIFPTQTQEVQGQIQSLTLNVFLKNKYILQDICRSLGASSIEQCSALTMFA